MRGNAVLRRFLTTASLAALAVGGAPVLAQDAQPGEPVAPGEFLGDVELGSSKRDVQTGTAEAVTVINEEEINDRQAGTIGELIDSVPGVTLVNGSTPQGSGINIRGYGANSTFGTDQKVLVLIDGATTGSEELYRIGNQLFTDPDLYKTVTVNRGTVGSFEYGSGVVGGVVQLETIDASDLTGGEVGFRFRQVLGAQSNGKGFNLSSTLAWQATEDTEFLLNYSLRDQSEQQDGDGNDIGNSAFRLPSYLVKAKHRFGNARAHEVSFSYNNSTSAERDVPYDSFGTTTDSFGNVDRDYETTVAALNYSYDAPGNELVNLDVDLTYSDQKIDQTYVAGSAACDDNGVVANDPSCFFTPGVGFTPAGSPFNAGLQDADHRYETTKLKIANNAFFDTGGVSHDLRAGFELLRKERTEESSAPGGRDDRWAVYLVDDIRPMAALTVTPALRYESQDITAAVEANGNHYNSALMGGLSAQYDFANGFGLFGSAAYTESLPILDDLTNTTRISQPEKARTFEMGVSYDRVGLWGDADALRAKVNVYRTSLWDITSYVSPDFSPLREVETEGVEIEASYAMASGLYVDFNANLTDGTETSARGAESRWRNTPANATRLTLGKRFDEFADVSWELIANEGVTDANGERTAGFGVNNLRATFRPSGAIWQDAEIRVGLENVFDKQYTPYLSTRPSPGRNFKLTLSKTF